MLIRKPSEPKATTATEATPTPTTEARARARARDQGHLNQVLVVGRITAAPTVRELPSGDRLVSWRIGVARPEDPRRPGHRLDSLTLVSFEDSMVDRVREYRLGEVIRVVGALRRRIWRGPQGVRSILEVEVSTVDPERRLGG